MSISEPPSDPGPKPVAVITGSAGLIGSYVVGTASKYAPEWFVVGLAREQLDLTDSKLVRRAFQELQPRLVIHCAAISKPQQCQEDPRLAHRVNVEATALLADLARDIPFIFFSTDQVFDGREGQYDESSRPTPIHAYGETKARAEAIVLSNPAHTVIRTSLNGGVSPSGDRAFNEQLRIAWKAGHSLRLFTDEYRCPIPAVVTARAVWELAGAGRPGLYHLAGAERLSRWEIGRALATRWRGVDARMEPGSVRDYSGPPRPADLSLNCDKVQKVLSFPLPKLTEWLDAHPDEPF